MSMFLPDGFDQQSQPSDAAAISTPGADTTTGDIALMQRVLAAASNNPNLIPTDFMAYIVDFIQTSRLQIPLGQVFGYQNSVNSIVAAALAGMFVAHVAHSEGEVSITSSTYATFTGAPSISDLDDGSYLVLWGCSAKGDDAAGGAGLNITYQANGSGSGNTCESQEQNYYTSIARGDTVTLGAGAGANTIALLALTSIAGHTSKVRSAWLACLKYSN